MIVKNVNHKLEESVVYLQKYQAKEKQYSCRNDVKISDIPNNISDKDLENTVISNCKDSGVEIDPEDLSLPLSRNSRGQDKRVIVRFVNWKYSIFFHKERISRKSFNHLNVPNKVLVSVSLCPYYRYIWGKCKNLQRQGQVNKVFCL